MKEEIIDLNDDEEAALDTAWAELVAEGPYTAPDDDTQGTPPEALARAFTTLLADAYGRLLRVEADKAKRAENRGELRQWAQGYYDSAAEAHVAATIRPVVDAFVLAMGTGGDAAAISTGLAKRHVADSLSGIKADGVEAVSGINGRAASQAARHLKFIWEATR